MFTLNAFCVGFFSLSFFCVVVHSSTLSMEITSVPKAWRKMPVISTINKNSINFRFDVYWASQIFVRWRLKSNMMPPKWSRIDRSLHDRNLCHEQYEIAIKSFIESNCSAGNFWLNCGWYAFEINDLLGLSFLKIFRIKDKLLRKHTFFWSKWN